jgi:hypothetical protein
MSCADEVFGNCKRYVHAFDNVFHAAEISTIKTPATCKRDRRTLDRQPATRMPRPDPDHRTPSPRPRPTRVHRASQHPPHRSLNQHPPAGRLAPNPWPQELTPTTRLDRPGFCGDLIICLSLPGAARGSAARRLPRTPSAGHRRTRSATSHCYTRRPIQLLLT